MTQTHKLISAKDVESGLCPDKFAEEPGVSGHRPDTTSFVNEVLQRSHKCFSNEPCSVSDSFLFVKFIWKTVIEARIADHAWKKLRDCWLDFLKVVAQLLSLGRVSAHGL
jgi:hypothetical protein